MSISYYTEYRVVYDGGECIVTADKRDAIAYIRAGEAARLKGVYEIEHRMVRVGDWALTTKADDYHGVRDRDQRDHA